MRLPFFSLAVAVLSVSACGEPAQVTVITKNGRHAGTLAIEQVEVQVRAGVVKVPMADIATIQFGESDVIRTRQGKSIKGVIRIEGWTLGEAAGQRPLARADLRFIVPQAALGPIRKGQVMDAATVNGMTYHVRIPEKYEPASGAPAIVLFHGSNANSADYLKGITQRWPKVAADYVLIGIDGEWPTQKNPDGPPAFVYTYVNFVGKSKYKGFPGTDRESPALVAEAIAEIRPQLKLTRIFVTGHSQGGFLAYSCLMNYPELFDGGMPISAGLIMQCEPTAYDDPKIREQQRTLPIAILHGGRDPLVSVDMATAAYESFLRDGFPMLRLLVAKQSGHAFISLPFEEGIRWLEAMTSDDPRSLLRSAEQAFARREYRDALACLDRMKSLDAGAAHEAAQALRQKIEQLATPPAKALETAMRDSKGNGWISDFDEFQERFGLTDAAAGVMARYATLREAHEPLARKLWAQARKAFQDKNSVEGYRLCDEIVSKYYASSYYRYARRALDRRK